jgi:hypothetical protein
MNSDPPTRGPGPGANDETRLSPGSPGDTSDATRLAPGSAGTTSGGWLSSSGSIDHGRFAPGTVLEGRYRVIGLLGRGGMGEVYRADDLRLGQPVALKFLPETLGRDATRLAQFHNEVRTARQVSHPNVCRVYDIGDAAGHLFLTMEYVDGEDLSSLLRRIGRLPEDKAVEIARQICAGLAAAHERGVIHRDLKPANIMLDGAGRVRVMDFSLAAIGAVTEVVAGTPAYMAPEQLQGREVTAKSDIYALGLVLYELFTGKRAYDAKTIADLVAQHASGSITSPTEIVKTLDEAVERVILRCLDADPARRPATPLAVAAALPGGDPLAAALAAGETPSPEMVAAAGGESATLSPAAGLIWLALAAVLMIAVAQLADRTLLLARVPFTKPAAVLLDRADEIRRALGYTDTPVDQASAFEYDGAYLAWGRRNGRGESRWSELSEGRPAALLFWHRASPTPLIPLNNLSLPDRDDPPQTTVGMTLVEVDTKGRLLKFAAVPPQLEKTAPAAAATDWSAVFAAAALDLSTFAEITPTRTPPAYAEERRAWQGKLPEQQTPVTIEAAAYRGRPVSFEIVAPWTSASREPDTSGDDQRGPGSTVLILALIVAAVVLARRNLQSGRADRRGAFRLGAVMFFVYAAMWVMLPHVSTLGEETDRLFTFIGIGLFVGGVMYLVYLALEPFVRRSWPTMLVGWSRALAGRLRDPVIGRDLLIGTACGLAMTALEHMNALVPALVGWPEPSPMTSSTGQLEHARFFVVTIASGINLGLQNALLGVMMFTVVREIIKRLLARLTPKRMSADYISALIAILFMTFIRVADTSIEPGRLWLLAIYQIAASGLFLFVLLRYGLFAMVVAFTIQSLTLTTPLTLRSASLYAGPAWLMLGLVFAVAAVGLWLARSDEPLFSKPVPLAKPSHL